MKPGYGGSCLGPSQFDKMTLTERMQRDAVLLKPGQSMSGSFTFESKVLGKLKPGPLPAGGSSVRVGVDSALQ